MCYFLFIFISMTEVLTSLRWLSVCSLNVHLLLSIFGCLFIGSTKNAWAKLSTAQNYIFQYHRIAHKVTFLRHGVCTVCTNDCLQTCTHVQLIVANKVFELICKDFFLFGLIWRIFAGECQRYFVRLLDMLRCGWYFFYFASIFISLNAYKILIFNPRLSKSHVQFLGTIADLLVEAGHNVVSVSVFRKTFLFFL